MGFVFTEADARLILDQSEGKPDFRGGGVGHARARHVALSRDELTDRMVLGKATRQGMPIYTAFTSVADQARAVAAAVNAPASAAKMNLFFHHGRLAPGEQVQLDDVHVPTAFAVRMAQGGEKAPLQQASYVSVYLSKHPSRHRSMHIVTAFATPFPAKV